jgi:hypothetical protein
MKLFGKNLFGFKKPEDKKLYDFAQHGMLQERNEISEFVSATTFTMNGNGVATTGTGDKKPKKNPPQKIELTPKGLYKMEALNDHDFQIISDEEYLAKHIADAKAKMALLPVPPKNNNGPMAVFGGTKYGILEIKSIIERLGNRKRLQEFNDVVEKYPHTTSALINDVMKAHPNLRCRIADEFVPDFPSDAVKAMTEYNKMCVKLCGKETHFYVIADKKDFEKKDRRRDPILLAQSPFGFFWQILGAWDEEMIYLGDL